MPDFVEIQNEYDSDMFTIIGISLDLGGEDRVSRFVDDYGLNFPIVMGNQDVVIDYRRVVFFIIHEPIVTDDGHRGRQPFPDHV